MKENPFLKKPKTVIKKIKDGLQKNRRRFKTLKGRFAPLESHLSHLPH